MYSTIFLNVFLPFNAILFALCVHFTLSLFVSLVCLFCFVCPIHPTSYRFQLLLLLLWLYLNKGYNVDPKGKHYKFKLYNICSISFMYGLRMCSTYIMRIFIICFTCRFVFLVIFFLVALLLLPPFISYISIGCFILFVVWLFSFMAFCVYLLAHFTSRLN